MKIGDLVSSTKGGSLKTSGLVLELGNRFQVKGNWEYAHAQIAWTNDNTTWEPYSWLEVVHACG